MEKEQYDIIIIGAGVVGCAAARELSRLDARILVLEKEEDVCSGTSKANSAIIHAGHDAAIGSRKAAMNVRGSVLMESLSEELDIPYKKNGAFVICFEEENMPKLRELLERGQKNGVKGLRIISGEEARLMEPCLSEEVAGALYAPSSAICDPFLMTVAFAENAALNGAEFRFLTEVTSVRKTESGFTLETNRGALDAKMIVNAAGLYSDRIHNMVSNRKLHITPRRGEYQLLDQEVGGLVSHTIFQLPTEKGKGTLVTPTVHGNLMVGPNAIAVDTPENTDSSSEGISYVQSQGKRSVPALDFRYVITAFAGNRSTEDGRDFILGQPRREDGTIEVPGFFDAAGIESPGLSGAPAIADYLLKEVEETGCFSRKQDFRPRRKGILCPKNLSLEERNALIQRDPAYGRVVCRCEEVTEGEIIDAIRRPVGAVSMDGVKRRVRQGMGRCQAGFCTPRTLEILARELDCSMEEICKNRPGSELLIREAGREDSHGE